LLAYTARTTGGAAPLAEASDKVNELTKSSLLEKVTSLAPAGATVLVLGISYKPDTYITEESAGLHLAQNLKKEGRRVIVHDFAATTANNPALKDFEALDDVDGLSNRQDIQLAVICCPWPQYRELKFSPATKVLSTWQL
jgi:UDPglucose 6-dehydrogenase